MGKALIFKNADFSANSIGTLQGITKVTVGGSTSLWSQATSAVNGGSYGFLNTTEGYLAGIAIRTSKQLTFRVDVVRNGVVISTQQLTTQNTTTANTTLSFTPIKVLNGDFIGICTLSDGGLYKSSGGDVYTYYANPKSGTVTKDTNRRIFPWNFSIVTL